MTKAKGGKSKVVKSKAVKKKAIPVILKKIGLETPAPKMKRSRKRTKKEENPLPQKQEYLQKAMATDHQAGRRKAVTLLSENEITPNKKRTNKKVVKVSGMNSQAGRTGNDFSAPVVRTQPIGVMDYRQLMLNTRTNQIPDEWGVVNSKTFPMQNIVPTRGGKNSGRTGPIQ